MEKVDFTQGILAMEPDLHRFAYKLTSDRESANDLVQDCVLQALDNHEKFTHAKNLKGWMFTIMRNIISKLKTVAIFIFYHTLLIDREEEKDETLVTHCFRDCLLPRCYFCTRSKSRSSGYS